MKVLGPLPVVRIGGSADGVTTAGCREAGSVIGVPNLAPVGSIDCPPRGVIGDKSKALGGKEEKSAGRRLAKD